MRGTKMIGTAIAETYLFDIAAPNMYPNPVQQL